MPKTGSQAGVASAAFMRLMASSISSVLLKPMTMASSSGRDMAKRMDFSRSSGIDESAVADDFHADDAAAFGAHVL